MGRPVFDKVVLINGQQTQITSSSYEALRSMQEPDSSVTLWTNAICINQTDDKEKGEQIQQMKCLYESASYVYVWLDPAAGGSDKLMKTIAYLGRRVIEVLSKKSSSLPDNEHSEHVPSTAALKNLIEEVGFSFPFAAYKSLLERSW
jgi:hypothetical protein